MTISTYLVTRTRIADTKCYVYSVWEPSSYTGNHHTVQSFNGKVYGRLSTLQLPPELDALQPLTDERFQAVKRWREKLYRKCYCIIRKAFPELVGNERLGTIQQYSHVALPNLQLEVDQTPPIRASK